MRYIILFLLLVVAPIVAQAQSDTCTDGQALVMDTVNKRYKCIDRGSLPAGTATTMIIANDTVTGTTINRLAKLTGAPSKAIIAATTDTENAIGICIGGCGTTGNATIAILGQATCDFDAATTAGDYVIISTTTAGKCHANGSSFPTTAAAYGRVLSTNGASGSYTMELMTPDIAFQNAGNGKSRPAGSNGSVQFNLNNQFSSHANLVWDTSTNQKLTIGNKIGFVDAARTATIGWTGSSWAWSSSGDEISVGDGGQPVYIHANKWVFETGGTFKPFGSDGGFSIGSNGGGGRRINRIHMFNNLVWGSGGTSSANPNITEASGTGITVNTGGELHTLVYKVTLTQAAFSAAATTADATIATLPAKMQINGIWADVTQVFSGGAVATANMTCGKTAGGNEYLVSFDVKSATLQRGLVDGDLGASINRANAVQGGDMPSWTATTAVQCRMTTTGANTNALTQGSITYYIRTTSLP